MFSSREVVQEFRFLLVAAANEQSDVFVEFSLFDLVFYVPEFELVFAEF